MGQQTPDRARRPRIGWQTVSGSPFTAGGVTVTPQSRVLVLPLPGGIGVWHRPTAVLVERGGQTTRLPIRDATRLAQGALLGGALLLSMAGLRMARRTSRE